MTDLKAAAERLRDMLDGSPPWDYIDTSNPSEYTSTFTDDCFELAKRYLAECREDGETEATIEWLQTIRSADGRPLNMLCVRLVDGHCHLMAPGKVTEGISGLTDYVSPRPATRQDVRDLCRVLGVVLKEGA